MRGAGVFERNTYWILGTMSAVMVLWLAAPGLAGVALVPGTGPWVTWVGGATPDTLSGQPHRLFLASTAHLSPFHLLVNLVLLWIAGLAVARLSSAWMVPGTFIVSGVLGTAATLAFHGGYALGASAGVFGVFGALICLLPAPDPSRAWRVRLIVAGLVLALGALGGGDLVAHWAGFLAGVLLGALPWTARRIRLTAWACMTLWALSAGVHWLSVLLGT